MINYRSYIMLFLLIISSGLEVSAEEIVVYSARSNSMTRIPFSKYTFQTGINIKVVDGSSKELLERLTKEGEDSPADILITVDAGSLWEATQNGFLEPINSDVLLKNIPSHLRDPNNHWFGLSERARTIVYGKDRVQPEELSTYEDLALPKWKNRLCLRTSKKVYNQSLVAMMITKHGIEETEKILNGWVHNLADKPYKKDTDVIMAITEGKCDIGIVNHYYLGRVVKIFPETPVSLFWPNQGENESGVYVDISGAGVLKNAKNKNAAKHFLDWLSSEKAQNLFADSNLEYPVNPNVKPSSIVQRWGEFKQNKENISQSGNNRDAAIELMKKVNYR